MDLNEFKSIFSSEGFNYLNYPEARELVKLYENAPDNELVQGKISDCISNFIIKDLKNYEKSWKTTILVLKVFEYFSDIFNIFVSHRSCRTQRFSKIQKRAEDI